MLSVPWVMTTRPSNTLVFCTSSTCMRSDSRLIGLPRSARSACAVAAHPRQAAHRSSSASSFARIEGAPNLRQQRELPRLVVEFHADPREPGAAFGDDHRPVGGGQVAVGIDLQIFGLHAQLAALRAGFAHHHYVAEKTRLLAVPGDEAAVGADYYGGGIVMALHQARLHDVRALVVGIVQHARGRKAVLGFAVG